jgi:hypothetical protein
MTDIAKSPHQNEISHSEERHTFQRDAYIKRCEKEGVEPDPDQVAKYNEWKENDTLKHQDPEWQKDNLEYVLRTTGWILEKARGDKIYAQHIYAALCNTNWQMTEPWPILKNQTWSCSWRHAGGIVADMLGEGDYIDWHCSGIVQTYQDDDEWFKTATEEQLERYKKGQAHVGEGIVTDEIREDFLKLGWQLVWEYVPD